MAIRHNVSQEFGIPRAHLLKPIDGDLLVGLGGFTPEARTMSPADLLLSLVMVEGYSYGGQRSWGIVARSAHRGDEAEPIFGSTQIDNDSGEPIAPEQALQAAEDWIRSSASTEFVPGSIYPLPIPDEMRTSATAGLL
jgi:hypothetical protein